MNRFVFLKMRGSKFLFPAALAILQAAFFLLAGKSGNIYIQPDSGEYLFQASNMVERHSFYQGDFNKPYNPYLETRRPPLTGLFIALIKFFINSDLAICFIQSLLSIFNLLLVVKLIRLLQPGFIPDRWHAAAVIFFPTQFIYSNMIMAEIFFQSLLLLSAYQFARHFLLLKKSAFNLAHLFIGLAALVKPVACVLWLPLLLWNAVLFIQKKNSAENLLGILIFSLVVIGWSARNKYVTGIFEFSSVKENYLPNYAALKTIQFDYGRDSARKCIEALYEKAVAENNYRAYRKQLINESAGIIKDHPVVFAGLSVFGTIRFFVDPGRWDVYTFFSEKPEENPEGFWGRWKNGGMKAAWDYVKSFPPAAVLFFSLAVLFNMLMATCFILFLLNPNINAQFRFVLALMVFCIAAGSGVIGSARYRMAVFPILLMALPSGISLLKHLWNSKMKRR